MPIATRPPEADAGGVTVTAHPVVGSRLGGASRGIAAPPSGDLLPSDGPPARDPAPAPARALALDALRLLRAWHEPDRRPERWSDPQVSDGGRPVCRMQLAADPPRGGALASSFGREAFHVDPPSAPQRRRSTLMPSRLAYALRWLELGPPRRELPLDEGRRPR